MSDKTTKKSDNEGEGSKTADRKYRQDVETFEKENDVEKLARQAANDVEKDVEGYRDAEIEGKRRSAGEDAAYERRSDGSDVGIEK